MALRAGFVVISVLLGLTVGYMTGDGKDAQCGSRCGIRSLAQWNAGVP